MSEPEFSLVVPHFDRLTDVAAALSRGWSPDNLRPQASGEMLDRIVRDPRAFIADLTREKAGGSAVTLPDGSRVPRLPSRTRWIWSGGFAGHISIRWQPGTEALPPTCLGHVGYSVVPWHQRRGLATRALASLLPEVADLGLRWIEITCSPGNVGSRKVIERNGGRLIEAFAAPASLGSVETLRYRVRLD